jgi:perosamine synthetase
MEFIHQVEPYITENEIAAMSEYLRSGGWLTEFKRTEHFEQMIADFLGVKHTVVVNNGTAALYLSLLALGIRQNDSVIIPDYTMIASPNSVKWTGADVILCDIEPDTACLDLTRLELQKNTKALMYVSINGRSGNMDRVVDFCKNKNLYLVEDACQAFGSKWNDKFLGTFGDVGVFSFSPHKIITTGQGGAIVTNSEEMYGKLKKLKDFLRIKPGVDIHTGIGYNFKFTDIQAVIGIEQIKTMDFRIKRKKEIYEQFQHELSNIPQIKMIKTDLNQTVPWFMDILVENDSRDELINYLKSNNIGSRVFYPPIHTQEPYSYYKGDYQVSNEISKKGMWLPSSIGLEQEEINSIVNKIKSFFR